MATLQLISITPEELSEIIGRTVQNELEKLIDKIGNQNKKEKEFISRKEASELLGVSYSGLHKWCNEGKIKLYKFSSRSFFKHSEIIQILNNSNVA